MKIKQLWIKYCADRIFIYDDSDDTLAGYKLLTLHTSILKMVIDRHSCLLHSKRKC